MSNTDLQCCLCKTTFTLISQPRMMPYCQHSACTPCLKQLLNSKTTNSIKCQHCGHQQNLQEADLEYFPKNISLNKIIKELEANPSPASPSQEPKNQVQPSPIVQKKADYCRVHNKELEIICLTDRERLCPHCALFGKHKNHVFKTLFEAQDDMKQRRELFHKYLRKKQLIQQRYQGNEFRQGLIQKINTEKQRLIFEIKGKFGTLQDNIRLAEKQAYDDLSKNFKTIYKKISKLLKQQKECQTKFKEWKQKCQRYIAEAETKKSIEEKAALYFGGPLEQCTLGKQILMQIEDKMKNDIIIIEKLIGSVRTTQDREVGNSIFNYLSIYVQSDDFDVIAQTKQEIIQPKNMNYQSPQIKVEFSSAQSFGIQSESTWIQKTNSFGSQKSKRLSTPQKRSSSKDRKQQLNRTSQKRKVGKSPQAFEPNTATVQKMVEDFCQRDNLDTLDLTGYSLSDSEIVDVLRYLKPLKKIKGLKLVKNNLTNDGLSRIVELIPGVTNLNLSFNVLGQEALGIILASRQQLPLLRIINISNNKINERKARSTIEELKRQGIIVTN